MFLLAMLSTAYAKPEIQVISRYDAHVNGGIVASEFVRILNKIQDD